jgi:hypothetical protein
VATGDFTPYGVIETPTKYNQQSRYISSPQDIAPYKLLSDAFQKAQAQYPILQTLPLDYRVSANKPDNNSYLETWPINETGGEGYLRPTDFPIDKLGIEVFKPTTRPKDIMADIVSHELVNSNPVYKKAYDEFISSLQPWQHEKLQNQYNYAKENENENRPFAEWASISGLPSYFRGNLFDQWQNEDTGDTVTNEMYTPNQLKEFSNLKSYMKNGY